LFRHNPPSSLPAAVIVAPQAACLLVAEAKMRNSAVARLVVMGLLTVTLLVPLTWVYSIVTERATRREGAVAEIGASWGGPQVIAGPVLSIPYVTWSGPEGRREQILCHAHFLARDLQIDGTVNTQIRQRGIFGVVVFGSSLKLTGRFLRPDMDWIRPVPERVEWDKATISVGVADPRGLARRATLRWQDRESPFTGGVGEVGIFRSGIHANVAGLADAKAGSDLPFELMLQVNGTRDVRFLANAEETSITLTSNWPHPSFVGGPFPETRRIDAGGFAAHWRVPDFGRPYPARWTGGDINRDQMFSQAGASAVGVTLVTPVDIYQQAERAVKYAVLFIVLTFLVFFLWEVLHASLLHPMQYGFVGFALCVFYLLLVSISEHAGFDIAYAVSAGVTTLLIAGYARAILGGVKQAASVLGSLTILYGFLYLLLRLEDYALLAGSIGLFVILAGVMYLTRSMNWYELKLGKPADV
jgi:inner membrane protein